MKSNRLFRPRTVALVALLGSVLLRVPASGLGQATPVVAKAPDPQPPSTAPFQASPLPLPPTPTLPAILNLGAWLGLPTTFLYINGKPERVGISTGLNANTVLPTAMTVLDIPEGKTKVRVDILDRQTDASDTMMKSIQIGLLKLENIPVAQVDVVALLSHSPHPGSPLVWLGTPFLSAFQVTLDLAHKVCILDKPLTKMPAGAIIVPMTVRDGHIFVSMTLPKSKPFPAMLDTGTILTLIPATTGEKLKLPAIEVLKLGGAGGKLVPATLIQVPQIAVGKAECKALRVAYLSADLSPTFGRETAVLGLDFLSHFKVILDFAAKKVAFIPPAALDSATTTPDTPTPRPPRGGKTVKP